MKLADVLREVAAKEISGRTDVDVTGIACDSRLVREGFLFVAIRGEKADGHGFIEEAVSQGARAIICESCDLPLGSVTKICVSESRRALAQAAANFHASPSESLGLVGITGTNGKTTVCHLVRDILRDAGWPCGMIGTVGYQIQDELIPAERTTPDPLLLNALLAKMKAAGCRYVAMEVSSHSLQQRRVESLDFDVAVFTNLTRDHLDYHRTLKNYLSAKASLFETLSPERKNGYRKCAVICADQPEGAYIADRTPVPVLTYGLKKGADVVPEDMWLHPEGASFVACTPWGTFSLASCLIGRHNVSNVLAATTVALSQGVDITTIQHAVSHTRPVPGRLEFVPNDKGYSVVVDYAHTDDALTNVLTSLSEITRGRLIVVFGCGGDRDRGKRKKMGRVASRLADFAVVTSDNPRSEDPMDIISDIVQGFNGRNGDFIIEADRTRAIEAAVAMAREGDTVLIAGKGHETYQQFKDHRIHFDDREAARDFLARRPARETGLGSLSTRCGVTSCSG